MQTIFFYASIIKRYAFAHKTMTAIALVVVVGGGWWIFGRTTSASAATRYVVGQVERGTVVASVSASGQIAASNQIDLKPKASGDITYVGIKVGQEVQAGQLLVRLDSGTAASELSNAQISYQQVQSTNSTTLQQDQVAATQAAQDLSSSYVNARAAITKASSDIATTLGSLDSQFSSGGYLSVQNYKLSDNAKSYRSKAQAALDQAHTDLDTFARDYSAQSADTPELQVDATLSHIYTVAVEASQTAKYALDAVVYIRNQEDTSTTAGAAAFSAVTTLTGTANGIVSSISSAQSADVSANRTLEKAQSDLNLLVGSTGTLDLNSAALAVRQKQEALADYSVYAPFAGVVASVAAHVGDQGSSGTAVATLITKSQVVQVSLNEVDAAKVKAGQKATLTFDAIDSLTLTGTVAQVDGVGTVSQGVVSYGVQIALDSQDARIKPGMTVNASIQTDTAQDTLVVPASAVKTSAGQSYVLAFEAPVAPSSLSSAGVTSAVAPIQIPVEVGISDDTSVQILSGLTEGQQIITRTITASASSAASGTSAARAGGVAGTRAGGFGGAAPAGAALRGL